MFPARPQLGPAYPLYCCRVTISGLNLRASMSPSRRPAVRQVTATRPRGVAELGLDLAEEFRANDRSPGTGTFNFGGSDEDTTCRIGAVGCRESNGLREPSWPGHRPG